MNKKKHFGIFLFSIILLSVLTSSIIVIITSKTYITNFLIWGFIIFFLIHSFYYKFFLKLIRNDNRKELTQGLFYSSIAGTAFMLVLTITIFLYTNSAIYNRKMEDLIIMFSVFITFFIHSISAILMIIIDIKKITQNRLGVIFGAISFYFMNILICAFVFFALNIIVWGFF